jgi:monovalent cation:H+ antiporter-2, CPA2 family
MIGETLFISLAEIIIFATIASIILRKLNQPNLFSYIIAGIIIGPLVLGSMDLSWLNLPFTIGIKEITPEIRLLSELGAAFLLFSIGIETSVKRLLGMGKPLLIGTLLQVIGVIGVTVLFTNITGLLSFEASLFVGTIIAFSSTMVVIKLLADSKETNTLNGRIIISILLIQDILVILFVPLLQNFSQITNPYFFAPIVGKSLLLVLIAFFSNKFIFPRLFNIASKENEVFFLSSISTAFIFIGVSFALDIPISVGAFIGGLALNNLPYNTAIFSKIRALRDFFLTIFFVSLGAELNFSFASLDTQLMFTIIILIFIFKPLVFFVVSLLSGYGSRLGLEVGLSLAQVSEFGFVIAGLALTAKIFSLDLFSFIVAISALSMILTPHIMNYAPILANFVSLNLNKLFKINEIKLFNKRIEDLRKMPSKVKMKNHIVIIGGGLIGRKLARKLKVNHKVIIVDSDPEVVTEGKNEELPFVYGTSEDAELLEELDLSEAKLIIITMTVHKEAISFVNAIKKISNNTCMFAASAHFYDSLDFYDKGVDFVSMPVLMGIDELYKKIDSFRSKDKIFISEKAKSFALEYVKDQANLELKFKKKLIA